MVRGGRQAVTGITGNGFAIPLPPRVLLGFRDLGRRARCDAARFGRASNLGDSLICTATARFARVRPHSGRHWVLNGDLSGFGAVGTEMPRDRPLPEIASDSRGGSNCVPSLPVTASPPPEVA